MAAILEAHPTLRSAVGDRNTHRGPSYTNIGTEPPIEADNGRHSPADRRRISVRWLCGTILTGLAGAGVLGGAIFAALDREANFAAAPQTADIVRVDDATGELVNPAKSDRLVRPVDIVAAKQSFKTPTTIKVGDKEVVKVHSFTHVSTTLTLTNTDFADAVPAFNPLNLLADNENPAAVVAEATPVLDDAEASFAMRDLGALSPAAFTLSNDEARAQVAVQLSRQAQAGARALAPIPGQLLLSQTRASPDAAVAGGSGYVNVDADIISAPSTTVQVRMVPENATTVGMSDPAPPQAQTSERLIVLRHGDTLEDILRGAGATADQIAGIVAAFAAPRGTPLVAEGKQIKLMFADMDGTGKGTKIAKLSVYSDQTLEQTIALADSGAYVLVKQSAVGQPARGRTAKDDDSDDDSGSLRLYPSLYETALKQAVPKPIIDQLVHIFSNDVDFQRPVAAGDSFEAFYDEGDASTGGADTLLFALLTTHGETHKYYRFQTPDDNTVDYYDPDGKSSRKFLLRKPLAAGVETSPFGQREHPILGYVRMHTGVDWAAPQGTPILATGNGTITKAGRDGGYGNRIEIQHANGYITTYNHLSGFARGVTEGMRVRQGQVIAFLGATGLATGPNIHYEVIVNGNFVDPMAVKLPRTRELSGPLMADFQRERDRIDALISQAPNGAQVASTQAH